MSTVRSSGQRSLIHIVACLVSAAFAVYFCSYFLYDESVYATDLGSGAATDEILWLVFVALNIALCAFFLIYVSCCFSVQIISFLAMIINIWAIVYIVMVWIGKQGTIQFDTAAAFIGMLSSIVHSLMVRYCIVKGTNTTE